MSEPLSTVSSQNNFPVSTLVQKSFVQAVSEPESSTSNIREEKASSSSLSNSTNYFPKTSDTQYSEKPNIVQASSVTEDIPELPKVVKNLASTKILGNSKPLVQKSNFLGSVNSTDSNSETNYPIQRNIEKASSNIANNNFPINSDIPASIIQRFTNNKDRNITSEFNQKNQSSGDVVLNSAIPSAWLSIDELIGENTVNSTQTNRIETATPIQRSPAKKYDLYSNVSNSNNGEAIIQMASTVSEEQAIASEEIPSVNNSISEEDTENEDSKNLEILAREIYGFIRQRLEIERERQGGYHSDRLPW